MSENYQNNESQDRRDQAEQHLLDTYMQFRSNLPEPGHIQENKTTLQIQDELQSMMHVDDDTIVTYMLEHDYSMMTEPDGTVSWAIWRQM